MNNLEHKSVLNKDLVKRAIETVVESQFQYEQSEIIHALFEDTDFQKNIKKSRYNKDTEKTFNIFSKNSYYKKS